MERARHKFRILKYVTDNCRRVRNIRNFSSKCSHFKLILGVIVICLSLPNIQVVVGAQVGTVSGESEGGINNSSHVKFHREILHSKADEIAATSTEKVRSETGVGESESKAEESIGRKPSIHVHENAKFAKSDQHSCKDCNYGMGSDNDMDLEEDEEAHKMHSILRDIFLDELGEDTFDQNFDAFKDSDQESSDSSPTPIISRHKRSEPENADSLFPEGRGHRGIKGKGTRGAPEENNKRGNGGNNGRNKKKSGSNKSTDLTKYNEYMDAVFNRMNAMIKKKHMDPLRVNLYAGPNKGNHSQKQKSGNKKQKHSPRMDLDLDSEDDDDQEELDEENGPARKDIYLDISRKHSQIQEEDDAEDDTEENEGVHTDNETVRKIRALLENAGNSTSALEDDNQGSEGPRGSSSKPKKPKGSTSASSSSTENKTNNKNKKNSNKKKSTSLSSSSSNNKENKNKNKNKNKVQKSKPTRGILLGLSTLKREGNVAVIRQGDKVRVVRANFLLGPVSLNIMPRKSKSDNSDDAVAATATASKLKGILEVRLKKGSPTRIRKLRVYPPKSVKVDGANANSKNKPKQYGKVTPMATARLRQIASTVVRQTDKIQQMKPPLE